MGNISLGYELLMRRNQAIESNPDELFHIPMAKRAYSSNERFSFGRISMPIFINHASISVARNVITRKNIIIQEYPVSLGCRSKWEDKCR